MISTEMTLVENEGFGVGRGLKSRNMRNAEITESHVE